ncbi:thiosulfate oxidation carrier complex protein SoxZ [Sulfurimonas sp.]|uniref:thiosulfate oxidation carrier complex protein SoxZ n=1 Tax=Sulfurimonas sp. TaxID=2022749 RepID=UPI002AB0CC16|nr:thiosulfate oxidation carrier complex protein SoxZ [Sulfurimonas sp.]
MGIRVKAKLKKGIIKVTIQPSHAMTTYNQAKKKTGDSDNANFITHMSGTINGETVFDMSTSQFLSKNPIFKLKLKGETFKKKDKLIVTWVDRKGKTETKKGKIK